MSKRHSQTISFLSWKERWGRMDNQNCTKEWAMRVSNKEYWFFLLLGLINQSWLGWTKAPSCIEIGLVASNRAFLNLFIEQEVYIYMHICIAYQAFKRWNLVFQGDSPGEEMVMFTPRACPLCKIYATSAAASACIEAQKNVMNTKYMKAYGHKYSWLGVVGWSSPLQYRLYSLSGNYTNLALSSALQNV